MQIKLTYKVKENIFVWYNFFKLQKLLSHAMNYLDLILSIQ